PGGLIVDYIGIAQNLKTALADYSDSDRGRTGIDEEQAVAALKEWYERVAAVFHGFDYKTVFSGTSSDKLRRLGEGLDWVLKWQEENARQVNSIEEKKAAHRAFQDLVLGLGKAFALASASDFAQII